MRTSAIWWVTLSSRMTGIWKALVLLDCQGRASLLISLPQIFAGGLSFGILSDCLHQHGLKSQPMLEDRKISDRGEKQKWTLKSVSFWESIFHPSWAAMVFDAISSSWLLSTEHSNINVGHAQRGVGRSRNLDTPLLGTEIDRNCISMIDWWPQNCIFFGGRRKQIATGMPFFWSTIADIGSSGNSRTFRCSFHDMNAPVSGHLWLRSSWLRLVFSQVSNDTCCSMVGHVPRSASCFCHLVLHLPSSMLSSLVDKGKWEANDQWAEGGGCAKKWRGPNQGWLKGLWGSRRINLSSWEAIDSASCGEWKIGSNSALPKFWVTMT